ncbi:MAG TPA: hypothetical protein VJN39_12350 [Gemmatimonadales bacterium]|nr:hypothetical protein [Gemmatimonadales bacterium]
MGLQRRLPRWGATPLVGLVAACYSYTPLPTLEPVPETRVALVLSDVGRVGAGPEMGPGVARIEGAVVGSTDSEYTLRITGVTDIRGHENRWSGESFSVRRTWVGNAYERRFSKSRTYLLVGFLTVGVATFAATRHLFGIGSSTETPGSGGGSQQ